MAPARSGSSGHSDSLPRPDSLANSAGPGRQDSPPRPDGPADQGSDGLLRRTSARLAGSLRAGPLADRNFRLLTAGQTTSTIGDFCYAVALPWMVLSAHGGVGLLGLVLACYGVPRTALIPVGGILADKITGRTVMLAADATRCCLVLALLYLDARHVVSLAALGPVAALVGACGGLFIPASYTILPQLLAPDLLQAGNAISSAGNQFGAFAGPALAGALVAAFGPAAAFGTDAATFAVSAITLLAIRPPGRIAGQVSNGNDTPRDDGGPQPTEVAPAGPSGLRRLLREPVLQTSMAVALIANLVLAGTFEVAMPDLAHARFGPAGYGAMLACFGAGALAGSLAAARTRPRRAPAVTACRVFLVAAVAVAAVPYLGGLPGACAAILVLAMCASFGDIIFITLLQRWAPADQVGRVMSMIMLASMGSFPVSAVVSGFLVQRFHPQPFFPAGGIVLAVAVLIAICRREFRTLGTAHEAKPAATRAPGPAPAADAASAQ
ncbi:MAG TPA: MFS transporter [Streptosporangiaceae bacterium]|nr:MFS transporter [Streptosporangiaceae bacterium]